MTTSYSSLITNNSSLIEGLLQTIESIHSTVQGFCEEIAMLRKQKAEDDLERKRLMKLIEAKDGDIRKLTEKITGLLGKVNSLTKALEDKSHRKLLSAREEIRIG